MGLAVESLFHAATSTFSHLLWDVDSRHAAVVDAVLDYDAARGLIGTAPSDALLALTDKHGLSLDWILETHAHADHLSGGAYLRERSGAPLAIGAGIVAIQRHFREVFAFEADFAADGRAFDRLLSDGERLALGGTTLEVLATPGHTPDSMSYLIDDALFVGDTLFAPDTGTARCDFPGGAAATLYASIRKLYALPDATRVYLCHDYPPGGRAPHAEFALYEQRTRNPHLRSATSEAEYVALRLARDATLAPPALLWPSIQFNIRGGRLPPADAQGRRFFKIPLSGALPVG